MMNEEELQLGLQLPVRAAGSCSNIVEELRSRIERLTSDLEDPARAATDRNGPALVSSSSPVRSNDRSGQDIPTALQVIKKESI